MLAGMYSVGEREIILEFDVTRYDNAIMKTWKPIRWMWGTYIVKTDGRVQSSFGL